jgi:hypothetical protein
LSLFYSTWSRGTAELRYHLMPKGVERGLHDLLEAAGEQEENGVSESTAGIEFLLLASCTQVARRTQERGPMAAQLAEATLPKPSISG